MFTEKNLFGNPIIEKLIEKDLNFVPWQDGVRCHQ
jgi:hypothetical protein